MTKKIRIEKTYGNPVKTILYVDDDDAIKRVIVEGLELAGFKVYTASNGIEGLEKYQEFEDQIDLIISDVIMPKMIGPKMIKKIKDKNKNIPVILVSGYSNVDEFREYTSKFEYKFLEKPFTLEGLISAFNSYYEGIEGVGYA